MDLEKILEQIKQGTTDKTSQTLTPRFKKQDVRIQMLNELNKIALKNSFGKKSFQLNDENRKAIELICMYFNREIEFENQNSSFSLQKGVWICGNYGSGKTILLQAYRNLCRRFLGSSVGFKTCQDMNDDYMRIDEDTMKRKGMTALKPYVDYRKTNERIFDDLGAEETYVNDFGNKFSTMTYILSERYKFFKNGIKTHITTNLTTKQVQEKYGGRIDSRCFEMFNFIVLGSSQDSIDYRKF